MTLARRRFFSSTTAAIATMSVLGEQASAQGQRDQGGRGKDRQDQDGQASQGRRSNSEDGLLAGPYDFTDPYDWLTAYAKVRGRLDGGVGLYHYVAHVYGIPDGGVAQLMFRREGVSQHRMTVRDDRTIDLRYVECNYTQHPETGALIDEFYDNPITGKLVPVRHQKPVLGPLIRINPTGGFNPDIEWEPPAAFVNKVGPPLFGEGRVFFNDDILMFRPGTADQMPTGNPRSGNVQLTEMITFSADMRDVQNPELMSAKSFAHIAADTPWSDWLDMDDVPGHMMMRYLAEKTETPEGIPSWLRKRIDKDYPKFFTDPGI
ncbi:MAG: DUF1838 family protein [Rhodospirillaceae bacterium]|jgi:hypothetical protein|nr:DUF1838 family protein [Rhodospirillaceae bacterium]MBT5241009.1 DUF1838 family protein [Rhodospirillaceae bacterium]MBT5564625.1 DUF1838 family protein [Rhodospirillaceae bacterium]MBT6090960.1 DUF1838 family protein [Rhodospirillaceae bacterium]MBT6961942.1 DUF1838 family protein [Rhodospirillaceae bacterium]